MFILLTMPFHHLMVSTAWHVLAWLGLAIIFWHTLYRNMKVGVPRVYFPDLPCQIENRTTVVYNPITNTTTTIPAIGCTLAASIANWLEVLLMLSVFGLILFFSTCMNSVVSFSYFFCFLRWCLLFADPNIL